MALWWFKFPQNQSVLLAPSKTRPEATKQASSVGVTSLFQQSQHKKQFRRKAGQIKKNKKRDNIFYKKFFNYALKNWGREREREGERERQHFLTSLQAYFSPG